MKICLIGPTYPFRGGISHYYPLVSQFETKAWCGFFYIGFFFILAGFVPSVRFLIYYFMGQGGGHIQSLIFAAILFIVGFQVLVVGLVADVISFNRRLIEETLLRVRRIELDYLNKMKKWFNKIKIFFSDQLMRHATIF